MRIFIFLCLATTLGWSQVTKETLDGVTNFAQVKTTVACAGATSAGSVAGIKRLGFASIIDLRLPAEKGADIDGERQAATTAGINFISLPFDTSKLDPAVVDEFLKVVVRPENTPAFIHCASGNRAAMIWLIKRVIVDKWTFDKAAEEATQLGLTNAPLKAFAADYIRNHEK